jgi:predicted PhzF superfamily epimerase YddE/YHI9
MKVLLSQGMVDESGCRFATRSGELICTATGGVIQMDFPATPPVEIAASQASAVLQALRIEDSRDIMKSRFDFFVVLDDESLVKALTPDMNAVAQLDARGVIVTAASETSGVDFVSRFFAPQCDVNEDPVTGSAHCALSPYWSAELGRTSLRGYQASRRGGYVECQLSGDRVRLSGKAQIVIEGELNVTVE